MINESGVLPRIEPILPWKYDCFYCGNPANGSHGRFFENKTYWVCTNCYFNVLGMRPVTESHLLDNWENIVTIC